LSTKIKQYEIAAIFLMILAFVLTSNCEPASKELIIREVDGVPVFIEYGIPYFTRFQETSHYQIDLSGLWKFKIDPENQGEAERWFEQDFDDSDWFDHPVPGAWNIQKKEWLDYVGAGWYRKKFKVPEFIKGSFVRIVLDGVAFHSDLWLNGIYLTHHSGGFTRWSLDISPYLNYGDENILVIRVDTQRDYDTLPPLIKPSRPLGWWAYGGIHRQVIIESSPRTTLCKLAVDTDHQGKIQVKGVVYQSDNLPASAEIKVRLYEPDGSLKETLYKGILFIPAKGLKAFKFERILKGIKPWSPSHPENLYKLEVSIKSESGIETQAIKIGFRKFEFKGTELYFNGREYFLRGINRHEDNPITGPVQSEAVIKKDIALLKELRVNFVRTAHYPNDPNWLDACDRAGILVETEIPLYQVGWSFKSLRSAEKSRLYFNSARMLIEMIERDRNHPSVVMWAVGDECFSFFPSIRRLYRRLIEMAKRFDPERPVTFAIFVVPYGLTPFFEISAGLCDVIYVNQYLGWYFRTPEEVDQLLDKIHKKWPDKPVIVSEMGAGAVLGKKPGGKLYEVGYSNARDFSEEFQLKIYQVQLPIIKSKPFVVGIVPWVFADFRDDKRIHNPIPQMNLKGLLTYDRQKKQAFYLVSEFFAQIEKEYE